MNIDKKLLDELTAEAKASPRKRMNRDMRNSAEDKSQRMLNALEPETVLPVHRHRGSSETVVILCGYAEQLFFDDKCNITERVLLKPNSECVGFNIEKGRWHKIVALESGTVIFEAKDGPYEPLTPEDILTL